MPVTQYAGHIPLSIGSRALLSVGSAMAAILNPQRGDMVAAMGETTAITPILENISKRMSADVIGRKLLKEQPRVTNATIDRKLLAKLPEKTLGREYLNFLENLNTHPDARPPVRFIDNTNHLYIMRRYRETHDFNHVVLEMKTNMLGEVVVKYFEAIQFGLPMCVSGAIFGASRLKTKQRAQFLEQYLPWVIEQADQARFFLAMDWENHFEKPLVELQKELGIRKFQLSTQK